MSTTKRGSGYVQSRTLDKETLEVVTEFVTDKDGRYKEVYKYFRIISNFSIESVHEEYNNQLYSRRTYVRGKGWVKESFSENELGQRIKYIRDETVRNELGFPTCRWVEINA